ncbi:MAG: arginyltransferase [Thioalkalispiraceae bacterium]|jgi:arginine-tRNA-protein transferase
MNDETYKYHALHDFRLFITPEHECSYLPERQAATLFVDPHGKIDTGTYSLFSELGFRRSGEHVYRPHCPMCNECKAMRIAVNDFKLSRSQKRVSKKNAKTSLSWVDVAFYQEHFDLYQRYMSDRHEGSSMDSDDPEHYMRMMQSSWCTTRLAEFRINRKLIAVAVTDWLVNSLSAVYTFFDPEFSDYSPGTFAILKQVEEAKRTRRQYLYLGYWIKECSKMAYKSNFQATEIFDGHAWTEFFS